MARTDSRAPGDSWGLASSVGITATAVAAARAVASRDPDAIIDDPYAAPLVRAVGVGVFARLADGEITAADLDDDGAGAGADQQQMTANLAVRTRYFDDFFLAATDAGIRQAVILGSGLDSRAYRLAWPAGTTVYEIDQPEVIAFKTRTLADLGAQPTATHHPIAIDLRDDWAAALRAAGFDTDAPTAWSAEGLLGYLPAEAQIRLLDTITALSAPGSRLATENVPAATAGRHEQMLEKMRTTARQWRRHGVDFDPDALFFDGDRPEATAHLSEHRWQVQSRSITDLFAEHGFPLPDDPADDPAGFLDLHYITATL